MIRVLRATGLILLAVCPGLGQNSAPLSFEVASIKPAKPAGPGGASSSRTTAGRVELRSVSLRECIAMAYRVKDYQISAPAWLGEEGWEIVAKLPEGAPSNQMPDMLQTLLAGRFKLQVHRDKKEFPGLALVVGSGGPKMKKADESGGAGAGRGRGARLSTGPTGGRIIAPRITMATLSSTLSALLGRPVVDETQISGNYEVDLEFGADDRAAAMPPMMPGPDAGSGQAASAAEPRASIFSSVQKIGLKLESRKVPLDVIVVDHAERTPTEN
jgi:uncharacterized protein (TIGR03435 family)